MKSIKYRLEEYRQRAQQYPHSRPTWRAVRYDSPFKKRPRSWARGKDGRWFADSFEAIGEDCGPSHTLLNHMNHTGWYCDEFHDVLAIGHVVRLRTARYMLYIPAVRFTGSDGVTLYPNEAERVPRGSDEQAHEAAIREAALMADENARIEAEHEREYHERDRQEQRLEAAQEEIKTTRASIHELVAELRHTPLESPVLCGVIKARIKVLRATAQALRKEIDELKEVLA